ncbi:hypothetical protein evm_011601 [Chilo suppressalis]|nr:hypothetical protein evm_011601 [Chilo suppressalis]
MLISLSTCMIITSVLEISKGAPKLRNALFDPLSIEGSILSYYNLKNHRYPAIIGRRRNANDQPETSTQPCNGYDFDEMKCKIVNNRILCGYNKNKGEIKRNDEFVNIGKDCHMRNDRIECGYVSKPIDGGKLNIDKTKDKITQPRTSSKEHIVETLFGSVKAVTSTQPTTKHSGHITPTNIIERSPKDVKSSVPTITKLDLDLNTSYDESAEFLQNDKEVPSSTTKAAIEILTKSSFNTATIETPTSPISIGYNTTKQKEPVERLEMDKLTTIAANDEDNSVTNGGRTLGACVEKDGRIVCYDTAQFTLFKKRRRYL